MLKPDYFYGKTDKVISYYQDLEDYILEDIATFLLQSGEIGGKADREVFILEQMGMSKARITKRLAELTKKSRNAVRKCLQDSVMTSFSNDKEVLDKYFNGDYGPLNNPAIVDVMDAEWKKTCGELDNLTKTTMGQYNIDVINLLNQAEIRTASGVDSYAASVCHVLDQFAKNGIVINYPTGARMSLESAVRCAVVTSMNQTAAQVTNKYIAEGGIEYVLVSAHMGARVSPLGGIYSHNDWQGKAYKIVGSEEGYPNLLESTGYDIDPKTGEGTVVNPGGLHGYNCRHSHQPWDKDLENPWINPDGTPRVNPEESRKKYEEQQQQRYMERGIRSSKRQLNMKQIEIDNLPEDSVEREIAKGDYDKLAYKLREKNKKYNEYCDEHDLRKQADRVKVAGFSKADAQKANGRATVYINAFANGKHLQKSISAEDIDKLKQATGKIEGGKRIVESSEIQDEVIDKVYELLGKERLLGTYSGIEIIDKDSNDVFITDMYQVGNWYSCKLLLNRNKLGGKTVSEIDKMFADAKITRCNSIEEAIIHEKYHAKMADICSMAEIDALSSESGIAGISDTALKDKLETISETGVLLRRGNETIPQDAIDLFRKYFKG